MVPLEHPKQIATFAVAVSFLVCSLIITALRCIARMNIRAWGVDDFLVVFAQLTFTGSIATAIAGCFTGFGVADQFLTVTELINAEHASFAFFPIYVATLMFIKTSICFTLLRIAEIKAIRYAIYALIAVCVLDGFIGIVSILTFCRPLAAGWDPHAGGKCSSDAVYIDIALFISVTSIITDFACAILPSVVLWNLQMKKSLKWSVTVVLSLGFFASAGCIVRFHYLNRHNSKADFVLGLGDLTVWSIVESGLGICLASIPALKPLFRSHFPSLTGSSNRQTHKSTRAVSTFIGTSRADEAVEFDSLAKDGKDFSAKITSRKINDDDDSEKDILGDQIMVSSEVELREERVHGFGKRVFGHEAV